MITERISRLHRQVRIIMNELINNETIEEAFVESGDGYINVSLGSEHYTIDALENIDEALNDLCCEVTFFSHPFRGYPALNVNIVPLGDD